MNERKTFTLDEIEALAELPHRTVRYYIQSGLIGRPQGVGKGAYYTQRQVEQLLLLEVAVGETVAAAHRRAAEVAGRRSPALDTAAPWPC